MQKKRVGIINGGGDCQGLNTVIDAVVRALQDEYEIYGFIKGYDGLLAGEYVLLTSTITSPVRWIGGTILKTVNKGPFGGKKGMGNTVELDPDLLKKTYEKYKEFDLTGLIVLGGDGTLSTALQFQKYGFNIIGIPKSIDNDLQATDFTFGFQSAVQIVTSALDNLHTTATSHDRVMICEVMGRYAGWIALYGGIAGGANCILIPEIPFSFDNLVHFLTKRKQKGRTSTVIVVAEGAKPLGGTLSVKQVSSTGEVRLGGIGDHIADYLNHNTEFEARCTNLGHLQRGGSPNAFDRMLSTMYGAYAARLFREKKRGTMVSYQNNQMTHVSLEDAVNNLKKVDPYGQIVALAKEVGIYFGD